ncbi:hypothetical protein S245_036733 [Arachis hypogaea]|nr:uncharacterized protein DS421_11g329860 [Arachis hypogaea]
MNACNCPSRDRDYFAPLPTPPLKFVFFSSCGVLRGGNLFHRNCHTYIHRDTYFTFETENQKRRNKRKENLRRKLWLQRRPKTSSHFSNHQSGSSLPQIR